jgi:hypothetical protein
MNRRNLRKVISDASQRFNIIRTEGRNKSIFQPNLDEKTAKSQLRHWKRMARNSGGHVYFDMVPMPADLAASIVQPPVPA